MSYQIRTGLWRPQRWAALVGLTALGLAGCMAGTSEEPNAFGPQGPDGDPEQTAVLATSGFPSPQAHHFGDVDFTPEFGRIPALDQVCRYRC